MTDIKIPEDMKPHDGSAKVPDDYDGGAVMLRGAVMKIIVIFAWALAIIGLIYFICLPKECVA